MLSTLLKSCLIGCIGLLATLSTVGCTHTQPFAELGIQPDHRAFIPARIAMLECSDWPNRTLFTGFPPSNVADVTIAAMCTEFDKYVIEGFSGQPYMRGYSPAGVAKALDRAEQVTLLASWPKTLEHQAGDCATCPNAAAFYQTSLKDRPAWRAWLQQFSSHMNQADAVLMPFVIYARERIFNDRGMWVAERDAHVSLLLIATDTGDLIWAGGRSGLARHQKMDQGKVAEVVPYPAWDIVMERLFVENLWRGFPGRQVY